MAQPAGRVPAESVIDLGELNRDDLDDRDDPVRPPRRFTLAVIAILIAVGLVGDDARLPLRPVLTTAVNATDFDIRGGVLYVFDTSYAPNLVSAYRLSDGRRLWEVRSPTTTSYAGVTQVGGQTLLVPNLCTAAASVSTVAVDTASGREVWRRPGTPERTISGGRLVLMTRSGGPVDCGGVETPAGAPPGYWDAVEAASGVVKWSIEAPDHARVSFDSEGGQDARWLAFVAGDGTVTTRDLLTGAITGQVVLPELAERTADEPARPDPSDVMVAGGQVLVIRELARRYGSRPSALGITAYDVVTLARRWDTRVETAAAAPTAPTDYRDDRTGYQNLAGCGPMLCARVAQTTVFLDPRDGAERWRTSLAVLGTTGGSVLIDPQATMVTGDQRRPGGLTVRDARTGELRASLRGWRIVTDARRDASRDAPLLSLAVGDRTWFGWLDPAEVRVVATGSAPGRYGSCTARPGYLACRQLDGTVRVWHARGA
jgi:hypothetical protein